jgi:CheY-like chemotaxis protein
VLSREGIAGAVSPRLKILYVENHATFARMASERFLPDHEITVVPSLALAREELAGRAFDVLLVDYDLDDGKGAVLVRELRAAAYAGPIVALSAHEDGNAELIRAGADAECPKLSISRIADVLASLDVAPSSESPEADAGALGPVSFECPTLDDVPSLARLVSVDWDRPALLLFEDPAAAAEVEAALRPALENHVVFASGSKQLSVRRVLSEYEVLEQADNLLLAMHTFRRLTAALARRLARVLHTSLRSLSTRELRLREGIPESGEVNRIWRFQVHDSVISFHSVRGLVLDVTLGYPEEFGVLDAGAFLAFLRGPFEPAEVSGVVRDDPRAVQRVLKCAAIHPQLQTLLRDDWHQAQRSLKVLAAAGILESVVDEEGQASGWVAPSPAADPDADSG